MSIAYNFEPDVSPIYREDEQLSFHSVHFSSADTPKATGRRSKNYTNKTLGTSHMYEISVINEQCVDEDDLPSTDPLLIDEFSNSIENKTNNIEMSDEVVPDSTEINEHNILSNTVVVLSAGCCLPIKRQLINNLEEMGANVEKEIDDKTTHLVVDRYADPRIVGIAINRKPLPPLLVDVKWIQECIDKKKRIQESDYSMQDCHYLKKACKRLSSFYNDENTNINIDEKNETNFVNMSYASPVDFIDEIRLLSERLDALLDHAPIIRYAYHSPDCPTRQKIKKASIVKINVEKVKKNLMEMSNGINIKRRRSFNGFIFEHRADLNEGFIVSQMIANRDNRNTWEPEEIKHEKSQNALSELNIINDMRKTMPAPLPVIRETYQNNAKINKQRNKKAKSKEIKLRKLPKPVRTDDSDIQSAMASLTISHSPEVTEKSIVTVKLPEPVIRTKSNFINRMLLDESCDDFVSDVSAYREIVRTSKNGIVFTGFNKDSDVAKKLMNIAKRFHMRVQDEVDEKTTRCVVSRHGKRTLLVLKAICLNIFIVQPQWLEESYEDSKLLDYKNYLFENWREVLNKRKNCCSIFPNNRRIFVFDGCQPDRREICWMIERCGGKITRHIEKSALIVAPNGIEDNLEEFSVPIVTPLFIIDSITHNEYLSPSDYLFEHPK